MTDLEYTRKHHPGLEEKNPKLFELLTEIHLIGHPELERTSFPKVTSQQMKEHAKQLSSMASGVKLHGGEVTHDYQ